MTESIFSTIESQLSGQGKQAPVHLWNPPLSGDINIQIKSNGDWYHEGTLIQRHSLVKLFASILRREEDGYYYLVTPVEKWRIQVEDAPLLIIDMEVVEADTEQQAIIFTSNVERLYPLGPVYPLSMEDLGHSEQSAPYLVLDNGVKAKLSRNVYYRLVAVAKPEGKILRVLSKQRYFELGSVE